MAIDLTELGRLFDEGYITLESDTKTTYSNEGFRRGEQTVLYLQVQDNRGDIVGKSNNLVLHEDVEYNGY